MKSSGFLKKVVLIWMKNGFWVDSWTPTEFRERSGISSCPELRYAYSGLSTYKSFGFFRILMRLPCCEVRSNDVKRLFSAVWLFHCPLAMTGETVNKSFFCLKNQTIAFLSRNQADSVVSTLVWRIASGKPSQWRETTNLNWNKNRP